MLGWLYIFRLNENFERNIKNTFLLISALFSRQQAFCIFSKLNHVCVVFQDIFIKNSTTKYLKLTQERKNICLCNLIIFLNGVHISIQRGITTVSQPKSKVYWGKIIFKLIYLSNDGLFVEIGKEIRKISRCVNFTCITTHNWSTLRGIQQTVFFVSTKQTVDY